jgi:2-oxoglutarate dehydrogenase E2 component (dihydrolipoamide succinyltransferase)
VKNIAKTENIEQAELDKVPGTGKDGRVTKEDLMAYLKQRISAPASPAAPQTPAGVAAPKASAPQVTASTGDEIVEMDRMRRLIADHMVMSKQVSPHVTSFIEVDVTNMVKWRERVKDDFQQREKEKITFTPIFIEVAAQALKDFPGVNASVDGYKVILRKNINIGMAAALPNGNLIVPVIKNADQKNLLGLAKDVNSLANKARTNKLEPDDISGGTFTITNLGTFGSITGSPIINQPQVAILGLGVIKKKPVVLETPEGDVIAIRHMIILSLAYDHRVVDGALGGKYLQRMQQLLESFDTNRSI